MHRLLHQFDYRITTIIQRWPRWLFPLMLSASVVGHPIVTVGIGVGILLLGWQETNLHLVAAGLLLVTIFYIGTLMKLLLRRHRPLTMYAAAMRFKTFSFPSGHSTGSTLAYGLLGYLVWPLLPLPWDYVAAGIMTGLVIVVGLSRVYLGAHFPSDVIAGWLLGVAGLVILFALQPTV